MAISGSKKTPIYPLSLMRTSFMSAGSKSSSLCPTASPKFGSLALDLFLKPL